MEKVIIRTENAGVFFGEITSNSKQVSDIRKTIDWEQRRYELAKYALQGMLSHSTRYKPRECDKNLHWHAAISKEATEIADELINQLQKASEN